MKYTLRQLEVFLATAHSGNISRAAEQLAMSQSAASSALREVEQQFDVQLFDRIETQLKQILREAELKEGKRTQLTATQSANLMLAAAEGRICQYVRSGFQRKPVEGWEDQWQLLAANLFRA